MKDFVPFKTTTPVPDVCWPVRVDLNDRVFMTGSCFAASIGERMETDRWNVIVNPFGMVYNPLTMAHQMMRLLEGKEFDEAELRLFNKLWHSDWHHGSFNGPNKAAVVDHINSAFRRGREQLIHSKVVILTWGHDQIFIDKEKGIVVANCHKRPSANFIEQRINMESCLLLYKSLFQQLKDLQPEVKIIITVSPVRYLRAGMRENTLAKARLHLLAEELLGDGVYYFPSYEMIMDEMRDYRYYADDMLHPSSFTFNWIYDRLVAVITSEETRQVLSAIRKINDLIHHKTLHEVHAKNHIDQIQKQILLFGEQYPLLSHIFSDWQHDHT